MEILFDTADLAVIEEVVDIYPCAGITSNPTILKAEGAVDLYAHMRAVRQLIGDERTLHVQVLAQDPDGIVDEAHRILARIDDRVHIKVPLTEAGLRAIRTLKSEGIAVTATAIYTKVQGLLAVAAGCDYLAPYVNRMENLDIDAVDTLHTLADVIARDGSPAKILAASFKNTAQVCTALAAGSHAVTVPPALLRQTLASPVVDGAVQAFAADWRSVHGTDALP
ncbi:fructose-6-phosphate aldolase, TalC/MipB family [Austwickia chelonae]|uniref:Putative transaldolase n=1 Tax=Austwickia chelonae NBRC 105200 TaxID=1184607 RepID=K6UMV2_9MICO|nr:fructose-6-phosphate aldolase [Austwickia chelonae]GAB78436.1 putative transaldolase [Austwickia chelonae NBRC 105200]SEW39510.1 fructose-6-phosphate aldolase, TalC/MipB family [Austwickia chelonae]